jgi:hypothetical protein
MRERRRAFQVLAIVLFSFASTSCGRTITIAGPIDASATSTVETQGPSNVVVDSLGGDAVAAITLADVIHRRRISVTAMGVCASSCAQYVFAASPHRRVARGSLLLFRDTATAMKAIVSDDSDQTVRTLFDARSRRELSLYATLGIDSRLLLLPLVQVRTVCYEVLRTPDNRVADIRFRASKMGWATSKDELERMGFRFAGALPRRSVDFYRAAAWKLAVDAGRVAFSEQVPLQSFSEMQRALTQIPRCDRVDGELLSPGGTVSWLAGE